MFDKITTRLQKIEIDNEKQIIIQFAWFFFSRMPRRKLRY